MKFPCVEQHVTREANILARLVKNDPFPSTTTHATNANLKLFHYKQQPFKFQYGQRQLPSFQLGYETWGRLNASKSNAILLQTGLSPSAHAKSHSETDSKGWWEKFIGPGLALDTDKYFVICSNVLGGCFGSTGPSTVSKESGKPYGTQFPMLTIQDIVRAQYLMLTRPVTESGFGLDQLYAVVGASMGGMQSLAMSTLFPTFTKRCVSISACARSHPYSIAMRFAQRAVLMSDPRWNNGQYYDSASGAVPPHVGMKLARMIAMVGYRSGPEWERRFGRVRANEDRNLCTVEDVPAFCPEFLVETYLDHQGEKWCLEYDANSMLYLSKAMDMFDLSLPLTESTDADHIMSSQYHLNPPMPFVVDPEQSQQDLKRQLVHGISRIKCPSLIMGVDSDILFPLEQQVEVAECLREVGLDVTFKEVNSIYGHDTFLIDTDCIGQEIKRFLG